MRSTSFFRGLYMPRYLIVLNSGCPERSPIRQYIMICKVQSLLTGRFDTLKSVNPSSVFGPYRSRKCKDRLTIIRMFPIVVLSGLISSIGLYRSTPARKHTSRDESFTAKMMDSSSSPFTDTSISANFCAAYASLWKFSSGIDEAILRNVVLNSSRPTGLFCSIPRRYAFSRQPKMISSLIPDGFTRRSAPLCATVKASSAVDPVIILVK